MNCELLNLMNGGSERVPRPVWKILNPIWHNKDTLNLVLREFGHHEDVIKQLREDLITGFEEILSYFKWKHHEEAPTPSWVMDYEEYPNWVRAEKYHKEKRRLKRIVARSSA